MISKLDTKKTQKGILYIVPTPIGNLKDITLRALEVLKEVDYVACEDTRHSKILLDYYQIKKPLISYHQHSRFKKVTQLLNFLEKGKKVALVTKAGTPGIADPGEKLIAEAVKRKIEVIGLPGPTAFVTALSLSGFLIKEFLFVGFLPKKKGRQTKLQNLAQEKRVIVLYESPYRIIKTLQELEKYLGDREAVIARELTKKFEEIYRGKISEVLSQIKPKGEFVIVIKPRDNYAQSTNH